jgi:hypothetical protein
MGRHRAYHIKFAVSMPAFAAVSHIWKDCESAGNKRLEVGYALVHHATKNYSTSSPVDCNETRRSLQDPKSSGESKQNKIK